ncbi:MAG: MGMT family protein [Bacteroidales bacterium]|nr:MAG: MGMT family protein [Bacteroidales bacterium]
MKKMNNENFFQKVYDITRQIPYGRITTYGAIAKYIGSPQSSRMVGWALNSISFSEDFIPAHRVVNRIGLLTGKHHFRYETLMQELLESEGVKVKDDRIVNFEKLFWDPSKELI